MQLTNPDARREGFMGFNVAMARRALIPHYDLGRYGRLFRGLCDPGKGLLSSRIRTHMALALYQPVSQRCKTGGIAGIAAN
jgi:hypothetical protein